MPYKTVFDRFTAGGASWMEPRQVWVEPTPQEKAAEEAHQAKLDAMRQSIDDKMDRLIADMKAAGIGDVRP